LRVRQRAEEAESRLTATNTRKRFITFEGGEGTGKSTQAKQLAVRLRELGAEVVVTREPGGTAFAEDLRATLLMPRWELPDPLSEALVFYAARADHIARLIQPALDRGAWVICDRFADSTRVYQGVGGGVAATDLDALDNLVLRGVRPGLTFVLDLDVELAGRRVAMRRAQQAEAQTPQDMFESRDTAFHKALREGFVALAHTEPDRCRLIDADADADHVAGDVWHALRDVYGL
jgi:dTMP kinase